MISDTPILIAAAFGVLLAHELGHLIAARFLGVTVKSIAIGLGPEILGFTDRHPLEIGSLADWRKL